MLNKGLKDQNMEASSYFRLLDLPAELRVRIYEIAIVNADPIFLSPFDCPVEYYDESNKDQEEKPRDEDLEVIRKKLEQPALNQSLQAASQRDTTAVLPSEHVRCPGFRKPSRV